MSSSQPPATAKEGSSLGKLHLMQPGKGTGSKNDVSGLSIAAPAGSQAGGNSDLNFQGGDKLKATDDFADAIAFRVSGVEKSILVVEKHQTSMEAKLDSLVGLMQQLASGQQQHGAAAAAAKPVLEVKADISASAAALTKDQEARLAAVKEVAFGSNASILGASLEQKKAILAAIDSKVSMPAGSSAGSAGPSSAALQQLQLDHDAAVRRQEEALRAKISNLGKAKSYPELNERIMRDLVKHAADKHYAAYTIAHATIVARFNDKRGFQAASFYHYEAMDKLAALTDDEDRRAFYMVNAGGNADLLAQVNEKFALRKDQQGNNNNRGGRGRGNNDGSFRGGRGRGGGRGSTEGATPDKKPGVV